MDLLWQWMEQDLATARRAGRGRGEPEVRLNLSLIPDRVCPFWVLI